MKNRFLKYNSSDIAQLLFHISTGQLNSTDIRVYFAHLDILNTRLAIKKAKNRYHKLTDHNLLSKKEQAENNRHFRKINNLKPFQLSPFISLNQIKSKCKIWSDDVVKQSIKRLAELHLLEVSKNLFSDELKLYRPKYENFSEYQDATIFYSNLGISTLDKLNVDCSHVFIPRYALHMLARHKCSTKAVYSYLCLILRQIRSQRRARCKQSVIANLLSCSTRTVERAFAELKKLELIADGSEFNHPETIKAHGKSFEITYNNVYSKTCFVVSQSQYAATFLFSLGIIVGSNNKELNHIDITTNNYIIISSDAMISRFFSSTQSSKTLNRMENYEVNTENIEDQDFETFFNNIMASFETDSTTTTTQNNVEAVVDNSSDAANMLEDNEQQLLQQKNAVAVVEQCQEQAEVQLQGETTTTTTNSFYTAQEIFGDAASYNAKYAEILDKVRAENGGELITERQKDIRKAQQLSISSDEDKESVIQQKQEQIRNSKYKFYVNDHKVNYKDIQFYDLLLVDRQAELFNQLCSQNVLKWSDNKDTKLLNFMCCAVKAVCKNPIKLNLDYDADDLRRYNTVNDKKSKYNAVKLFNVLIKKADNIQDEMFSEQTEIVSNYFDQIEQHNLTHLFYESE